jgi:hypothetical protein
LLAAFGRQQVLSVSRAPGGAHYLHLWHTGIAPVSNVRHRWYAARLQWLRFPHPQA